NEVSFLSYSTTHINWCTPDLFIKRTVIEDVKFNENLKAGQEYNFSCKLLLKTNSLKKIDKFLTLRRFHMDSIGKKRQQDRSHYWRTIFELHWINYNELNMNYSKIPNEFNKYSLLKCIKSYLVESTIKLPNSFHQEIFRVFKMKSVFFYLAVSSHLLLNKYHLFYSKLK